MTNDFRIAQKLKKDNILATIKHMKILGIDTSCDDTAIAIASCQPPAASHQYLKVEILSNVVSSQVKVHQKYGGVYPMLAKREHQKNLIPVLRQALKQAGLFSSKFKVKSSKLQLKIKNLEKILEREEVLQPKLLKFLQKYQKPKIDAIAVTIGPGLEPCLWSGVNFAKALALWWNLPIIPVNHLEAHLLANFLPKINENFQFSIFNFQKIFPAVGLVVSGGNTQLFLMKGIGKYRLLGETRDDAAGECLDKTARILGLDYPGGPAISKLASQWKPASNCHSERSEESPKPETLRLTPQGDSLGRQITLPRPMINSKDYDFSFSGLKTAVLYDYKKRKKTVRESEEYKITMAYEIQQAMIDVLIKKTLRAAKEYKAKIIILGGGVAANAGLRHQLKMKSEKLKINLLIPPTNLCVDNAAMVAGAACFYLRNKQQWKYIKPNANLTT